jgi:hypothetical protein
MPPSAPLKTLDQSALWQALTADLHEGYTSITPVEKRIQVTIAPFLDREGFVPHHEMIKAIQIALRFGWKLVLSHYDPDRNIRLSFEFLV